MMAKSEKSEKSEAEKNAYPNFQLEILSRCFSRLGLRPLASLIPGISYEASRGMR